MSPEAPVQDQVSPGRSGSPPSGGGSSPPQPPATARQGQEPGLWLQPRGRAVQTDLPGLRRGASGHCPHIRGLPLPPTQSDSGSSSPSSHSPRTTPNKVHLREFSSTALDLRSPPTQPLTEPHQRSDHTH